MFDHEGVTVTYLIMDAISRNTLEAVVPRMEPTALQKTAQQLRKAVRHELTLDFRVPVTIITDDGLGHPSQIAVGDSSSKTLCPIFVSSLIHPALTF